MLNLNDFYILTSLFGTKAYIYINNFYHGKTNDVIRYTKPNLSLINSIYIHISDLITDQTFIMDNIYLGSAYNANNRDLLDKYNIKTILNVTDDLPNLYSETYKYHSIKIRDSRDSFISKYLEESYKYITENNDKPILVHCYMGSSRSASVVIFYIMKKYNLKFEVAYSIVKHKRNIINPNMNFVNELKNIKF
jgi:protein-tyrosine phosphatase